MGDLKDLSIETLDAMAVAGTEIVECDRVLARTGDNVVGEALRGAGVFYEYDHYPAGDVYDAGSHAQYYYHSHRKGEHGHFHTYLRPKGMPSWVRPAPVPDFTPPKSDNDALSHIVAISMDARGFPIGLFTTNRWICGDTWYRGEDVAAMIGRFRIDHAQPSWPLNLWITAMLRLFQPQIIELLRQRDETVAAWQRKNPERNVYEDRDLDITSQCPVSVDEQIALVDDALRTAKGKRRARPTRNRAPTLA